MTYIEGQKVQRREFSADAEGSISRLPLAVMVNRGTANGAEVAAAALLDDKRAEVVGGRTYGNASVRKAITMDAGTALIPPVAKYYWPDGKAMRETGVTPAAPVA